MRGGLVLPKTAEYAIRAVLYIAGRSSAQPISVGEVAASIDVPQKYLAKTLNQLVKTGVLCSTRGPVGGFQLAVAPGQITLQQILSSYELEARSLCLLGRGICGEVPHCAVHERWRPIAREANDFFEHTTVADLIVPIQTIQPTLQ